MNRVLIVSAGMENPKKRNSIIARRQQYLNYGALTLATLLHNAGHETSLAHGGHVSPEVFAQSLFEDGRLRVVGPLLLSIPSFYALAWSQRFTDRVKKLLPSKKIIVGGRWVVDSDPAWIRSKLPSVDTFVHGLVGNEITRIVSQPDAIHVHGLNSRSVPDFNLHHPLVDYFTEFQPSIEASRGCGRGCHFCAERNIALTRLKDPDVLASHMREVMEQYDDEGIRPYIQSSFFAPNRRWADDLATEVGKAQLNVKWRCETRVDAMKVQTVASLAAAGLKVIDLGMEAACATQLLAMGKTENPDKYLRSASDLINACRDNGVWVKLNILIYAGETLRTHEETLRWMDDHATAIKGVSVGPVVIFGSPDASAVFSREVQQLGARLVDPQSAERTGITHIHPGPQISAADAEALSLQASRRFMTKQDYFDLKSFSYYPRQYGRQDFENDLIDCDPGCLPFR